MHLLLTETGRGLAENSLAELFVVCQFGNLQIELDINSRLGECSSGHVGHRWRRCHGSC